jgi:antibiotic biosynthesis monooxygenase (ABM) superfamily enzyme
MAVLTVVAVLPMQLTFAVVVAPHLHQVVVRSVLLTGSLVALMTWLVMPRLTRLARHWLYPQQS